MINTQYFLSKSERNQYLRYVITELRTSYFINLSLLARNIGINSSIMSDFVRGRKELGIKLLDKLEDALIDIYGALLERIIPQDINLLKQQLVLF